MTDRRYGRRRRRQQTVIRYGKLASVYTVHRNKLLHQHIARLCVLFEDLRTEVEGIAAQNLDRLDEVGKKGGSLYFMRRSVGTLHEFADALRSIDQLSEFAVVRAKLDRDGSRMWSQAVKYFHKDASSIARVLNHIGGHFHPHPWKVALPS